MSAGAEKDAAEAVVDQAAAGRDRAGEAGAAVPGTEAAESVAAASRAKRRELTVTVLIALLGGIIAWAAAGRHWATATVGEVPNTVKIAASGNDMSAGVAALGLTALAGGLALFATRRLARRLVGVLLIAAGVAGAVYALGEHGVSHASHALADKAVAKGFALGSPEVHTASWWIVALLGDVLVVLAGVVTVVRGATWPGMSSRYENAAPESAADTGSSKDLWDALDRGEDPTEHPTEAAVPVSPTPRTDH